MAEEESLRMAALKKAYAEIILNASKEAAARIMVADRKALGFEQALFSVREESLQMLLRLKQMLDSKMAEAEVKSVTEQRKIEELENQLSEAEGIIVDLREEISQVRDKVEKAKCYPNPPLSNHGTKQEEDDKEPTLKDDTISITNSGQCPTLQHISFKDPVQAVEIYNSQHKEVEPHLGEPSPPRQPPTASDDQYKSNKEPRSSSSSDSDGKGGGKTSSQGLQEELTEDGSSSSQSKRPSVRRSRNNMKYHEAIAALRRTSRGSRAKASVSRCSTNTVDDCVKSEARGLHPKPKTDDYPYNLLIDTPCNIAKVSPDKTVLKNVAGRKEGSDNHMDVQLTEPDVHDIEVPEGDKERRGSNRADDDNNSFKYIFQRKRKKEALTRLDENTVPTKNGVKRRESEDQRDISMINSSIVNDQQSTDTQDLLQIAHQLVSLSEIGR